jgi:hypothetical protein
MVESIEEIYNNKIAYPKYRRIDEQFQNKDKIVRFVLSATVDFVIDQNDIETAYSYDSYMADVQNGVSEREIVLKIKEIIEQLATDKIRELNETAEGIDIRLEQSPEIKRAEFYRFDVMDLIEKYKEEYNEAQEMEMSKQLTDIPKE